MSIKAGGHYPTFFNHVFYLSLPSEKEIKEYLNNIFEIKDFDASKIKNLVDYLLFLSGNDFFTLKRLLSDILFYDENNNPYIDVIELKNNDKYFESKSKLFKYIMQWFVNYNWSKLKRNWKNNSEMQKVVFDFLNMHYPDPFFDTDLNNNIEKELVNELVRIGHYKTRGVVQGDIEKYQYKKIKQGNYIYECTFDFHHDVNAELREEEIDFIKRFDELIRLANILDDLPKAYNDENKFTNENEVYKGSDGSEYSGVNLYATYSSFIELRNKLKERKTRLEVRKEDVEEANKRVLEQINLVNKQYWQILINILVKILPNDIVKNEVINNTVHLFSGIPFISQLGSCENKIFRKSNNSKIVILLNEFDDFDSLNNLEVLQNRQDILILNISKSDEFRKNVLEIKVSYKDKIGKTRTKKQKLNNFIDISLGEIKDLAKIMKLVDSHLIE